jgi:hypothetical protein
MRNGFLASVPLLFLLALPASAQTEPPSFVPGLDAPWEPPRTDLDERPNIGPRGYPTYGRVDYLLWWTEKDRPVPTLTADPAAVDFGPLVCNGPRLVLGRWLDEQQHVGLEAAGFWTWERSPTEGGPAVGAQFVSRLWGAEAQLRGLVYRGTWANADLLGGFRFLSLDEGLSMTEQRPDATTSDRFGTRNRFYGGQLGAEVELHHGKWFADIWGKAALGADCETASINGTTLAAGRALPGGVLESAAAAGRQHRTAFAVLPELGINTGYALTNTIRLTAGYTFFYLSDAARPGDQVPGLLTAPRPPPVHGGAFWGQAVSVGVEFRF